MKRALPILVIALALLALVWTAASYAGHKVGTAWESAGREPWPMELGTLEDFEKRFPAHGTSAAALRLRELALPLKIDFTPRAKQNDTIHAEIEEYVKRHYRRDTMTIDAPPPKLAEFYEAHARDLDATRDHLLRRGREIAWDVDLSRGFHAPIPNLLAYLHLARMLVARGLARGDWEDLHAASELGRSLHARPDMLSQMIALAIARSVNGAAWKMPLPPPAWLAEAHATNRRRLLLRGLQAEAWTMWRYGHLQLAFAGHHIYNRAAHANLARHQRETAVQIARWTECAFDAKKFSQRRQDELPRWNVIGRIALVDYGPIWARMLRVEAEEEAVANALRIRGGRPVVSRSACSDGAWRFDGRALAFTPELPGQESELMPLPLRMIVARESESAPRS